MNNNGRTLIRVFPRRTSFTPNDGLAFIGDPPLFRPGSPDTTVCVSTTFSWDKPEAERIAEAWAQYYHNVRLGGPAYDSPCGSFTAGVFVRPGVTFTTRGCIRKCPWCLVPKHEGKFRTLPTIVPGYIIQDNNLLAAPLIHICAVFKMLRAQPKAAVFAGGLDVRLMDRIVAEELCSMRIKALFLAADCEEMIEPLREAASLLAPLGREKLRCYVLLGFGDDTPEKAEARLKRVWNAGCVPFAQLYQPADQRIKYSQQWRDLARTWSRPAAMRAVMR